MRRFWYRLKGLLKGFRWPFRSLKSVKYFWSYGLNEVCDTNSFFTVNCPGSSSLLNVPSSLSCYLTSSMFCWYSFSNSSNTLFVFSKFSISSQVSDSAVNPFHHTRYLSFSLIHCLFNILLIFHSSSLSIMTGAGCSFLYSSTCSMYLCILLTFTTGYILIVLGNSNSTIFADTIFFTL